MSDEAKIPGTDEAWEEGKLGREEKHVKVAEDGLKARVDEALGLQLISIRLQKSLIDDFKYIAELNSIGYQTLMRQILQRFADGEKNRLLREAAYDAKERRMQEASARPSGNERRARGGSRAAGKERKVA